MVLFGFVPNEHQSTSWRGMGSIQARVVNDMAWRILSMPSGCPFAETPTGEKHDREFVGRSCVVFNKAPP
jgi:hypothetical protein